MKNLPAVFLPDILYRLCRNRNFKDKNQISRSGTNTWFLFRSTSTSTSTWLIRINHLYLYLQTIFIRSHVVKWESIQLAMPIKKKEKSLQCFNSFKDVSSLHQVLLYFTPWAAVFFKVIRGPWHAVQYFSIWKLCKSFSRQQIWNPLHCPPISESSLYYVKEESLYQGHKLFHKIITTINVVVCEISDGEKK